LVALIISLWQVKLHSELSENSALNFDAGLTEYSKVKPRT